MNKSCVTPFILLFALGAVLGSILMLIPGLTTHDGRSSVLQSASDCKCSTTIAPHSEIDITVGLAAVLTEEHSRRLSAEAQAKQLLEQGSQIIKAMDAEIGRLRKQLASPSRQANSTAPHSPPAASRPAPATAIPNSPPLGLP